MAKPYGIKDDKDEDEGVTVETPSLTGIEGLVDTDSPLKAEPSSTVDYSSYFKNLETQQAASTAIEQDLNALDPPGPDYAAYFAEKTENNLKRLKNNIHLASLADAEQVAEIQRLSEESGLPPSYIQGNVDQVQRMIKLMELDAGKLAKESPILAKQLNDPIFAALAYDDIDNLSAIETAVHGVSTTVRSVAAGVPGVSGGLYSVFGAVPGSLDAMMDVIGIDTEKPGTLRHLPQFISEKFQEVARGQFELGDKLRGDLSRYSPEMQSFFMGFESLGIMAPGMAGFMLTGNPAFLYGTAGVAEGGRSFDIALQQDMPYAQSLMFGITQGTTEAAFEMLPAMKYLRDTKLGSSFFKKWMTQLAFEIPQEQLTTITQEFNEFMILPSHKDMTFGDYLEQRPESAWHTLIATLSGTTAQTSTMHFTNAALNKYTNAGIKIDPSLIALLEDNERAKEALAAKQKIDDLAAKIAESKMNKLSPESLKGFISELFQSEVEGQTPEVIIYAQELVQYAEEQGIDLKDISPLIAEQVEETIATQGFFSFKVEDYLTEIANSEHGPGLNELLRINENAMSVKEANSWNAESNQKLIDQADAIISSMENEDKAPGEEVFNEVVRQLENIGVSRDEANQSAALYKAFFTIMGDRAGVDAKQLYDRYGVELQRNLPEGAAVAAQTQNLDDLADTILNPTEPKLKLESEEAKVFVDKIKQLKAVVQKAKEDQSDIINDEEAEKFYEANGYPAEIALLEAEIEYERLLQSRVTDEESNASSQKAINEKLERIAKIKGVKFVKEAAPKIVETVEESSDVITPEQIQEIRDYLESQMGVDLDTATKEELRDLIQKSFYDPQGNVLDQAAFHGTGLAEVFDQFSTDFIGTGEGAQAYGWGLYFTSKERIAKWYRDKDSGGFWTATLKDGTKIDSFNEDTLWVIAKADESDIRKTLLHRLLPPSNFFDPGSVIINESKVDQAIRNIEREIKEVKTRKSFVENALAFGALENAEKQWPDTMRYKETEKGLVIQINENNGMDGYWTDFTAPRPSRQEAVEYVRRTYDSTRNDDYLIDLEIAYKELLTVEGAEWSKGGQVYQVELAPKEEDYLMWDLGIEQQSDKVKKVIKKLKKELNIGVAGGMFTGASVYKQIGIALRGGFYNNEAVSKKLLEEGVRGVQFETGSTRSRDVEKEYNWVIFDEADVEITKVFNQEGIAVADKVAKFTDERIDRVIQQYQHPNQINASVVTINPADFVKAVTDPYYAPWLKDSFKVDDLDIERLSGEGQTPFVYVIEVFDSPDAVKGEWRIDGHEGRHRMQAMANAGITEAPLVVIFRDASWVEEKTESGLGQSGSLLGAYEKDDYNPNTLKYTNVVDIFQNSAEELQEAHGTGKDGKIFFQGRKEPTLEAFIAQKQGIPVPESKLLTTLHGRVENELQALLDKVKGDTELLTTRRLSKLFGAPKKRKDKQKLDRNVRPTGYKELKEMLDWAIANDSPGNWYKEFGEGFIGIVGQANLHEASILFGITSSQNAAETNFSDTLHIMALARQFDPIKQEKEFRNAVRNTPRTKGQRLKVSGQQIDAVVNMYKSGTYKGGLKVSTYMQLIRARGLNEFNPWSVQDVHMSRAFGYRYRDIDKKTGNVVDSAKFPSAAAIRYSMWMTNKLAEEYGLKPDAVQANLWFYAKKNLTPKKSSGKKVAVGDGTYQSAASYAAPEIEAIQNLVDAGTFNKDSALTTALETGERPSFTSDVKSDPFTNKDHNDLLLALAEARAPKVLVSTNPGNDRGYGFPQGTTLQELSDYNQEVLEAITDEDGQIKLLREMGIVHKVIDTFGTFQRVEPTFQIIFPGETFETAQLAAKLLGEAMMQDGTITEKTKFEGQQFGVRIKKADGSVFTTDDLVKIYQQVNPESKKDGLNFTRTDDGKGLKFLDDNYWDESVKYGAKELDAFQDLMSQYFSTEEYNIDLIAQESEYYDHTDRSRKNRQKIWDRSGTEGRSDLQRSAISSLYQPIHEVYGNWQRRLDFKPSNETSALAELLKVSESQLQAELDSETYNQQQRGSIQFRSSETVISLFEGADRSTFLHESGHLFLQIMQDLGEDTNASDNIKEDWAIILNFLGVKSGADIGVEQHEKWAESFEKYLFEGKAPSAELQGVFRRFKAWLMSVYKQLKNLNVEINDDIRGVFDRMLATPSEIQQAETVSRFIPMFENIEQSGMTQAEWNNYQDTTNAATRQAEDDLDRKKFKEEDNERKKWYREALANTKVEVENEVNKMPVYQAIHFLQFGEVLTGELLPGVEPMKLDKKALIEEFGQILGQLPKGRKIHTTKDGVHHEIVAEIFGFQSGQEMITQIMDAKPRKAFIEQVSKQRLMTAYKDMRVDMAKLEEEAIKSAHMADQRSRFLHLELKALSKRAGIPGTPAAAAREAALNIIDRLKVQDIHVNRYRAAELAAARAAEKAMLKENWKEAVKQKRAQLLNHHLYREAEKKKEEVEKFVRYFTRLSKPAARKRLARDYIDQIYSILEKVDLKKSVTKKARESRASFASWVALQQEEGNEVIFTEEMSKLLESSQKTHYKDMTFAELKEVYESVKNIEHIARWKQRLLDDRDKLDFDQTVDAMFNSAMNDFEFKDEIPDFTESRLKKFKEGWQNFHAVHDKIEYIAEAMDKDSTNGIWWRNLFKPIADASDVEMQMNEKFIEKMKTIMLDRYTRKERNSWNDPVQTRVGTFSKKNIIAIALNWGNEENRIALLDGFSTKKNWEITTDDIENMLDTNMEQRDWDMVQDIWIMIDELWPEVAALQKELTGIVPRKVEAMPFTTKFGTMRGGYYPLSYDSEFSDKQRRRTEEQLSQELFENSYSRASTRDGHTKERTYSGGQFVRLDLDVLSEHMHNVIHDLTHRKTIMQIAKLIKNEQVQSAIQGVLGKKVYAEIYPWLKAIAAPEPSYNGTLQKVANWSRHSATIVSMGWKVTTALVQPLGYSQSIAYLGEGWALKGLKNFYKSPKKNMDIILSKSVFMRNRTKTLDRDVRDSVKRIANGDTVLKDLESKYFYFIGFMDMTVSLPTWQAAYEKSIWEGMSEKDAVAQGDSAVRMSQGSGEMKDMARIQQGGPLQKLFTMFYSYFSAYYNMSKRTVRQFKNDEISAWGAFRQFVWLTLMPAVISELMLGRGPDDEDDEDFYLWALKETVAFPFMGMVGVRDVVGAMFNPAFGTSLPYTDVYDSIISAAMATGDLFTDDEFNETDIKNIIVGLGYAFKLPSRQAANIYAHLHEVFSEGEDFSLFELLVKVDKND